MKESRAIPMRIDEERPPATNRVHLPRALLAGALLLHILPFAIRPALIGGDEPHYALMAHSIATDFDLALDDDYDAVEEGSPAAGRKRSGETLDRHLREANGRRVFSHPIGLPLLAAPLLAIQQAIAPGSAPDIPLGLLTLAVTFAALVSAAKLLWGLTGSIRGTSLLLFATYFASPMWFYSRTFFTEPYIWAWSVLAITSMARRRFGLAALFLALALAMKETALLIVLPLMIAGGLLFGVRALLVLAAGPAVFAVLFALKNLLTVGNAFTTFQPYQWGDLLRGAVQLSVSPDRGLLWFAPLLALSIVGWFLRDKLTPRVVVWASGAIFASWFLVTAAWVDPAGGSSYGPRLLVPALPALLVPLYRLGAHSGGRGGGILFSVLALAGFVVNWCAALDPFTAFWGVSTLELIQKNVLAAGAGAILGAAILLALMRLPGGDGRPAVARSRVSLKLYSPAILLPSDARIAAGVFVLALVPFVWFYGGAGWNQDAHFDLTRALVERGTLHIDGYEANTGDVSTGRNGHIYINKAPGVSFLAAVPYAFVRGGEVLFGMPLSEELSRTNIRIVTAITCGVTGAAIGSLLFLYGRRRAGAPIEFTILVAVSILFGTIVFAYSTMLFAHVPAALFLLLAFLLVPDRPLAAGVAAGIATTCFYVCAIAVPVLAVVAFRRSSRSAVRFLAGGFPFALLLGIYHWICFGSPFRTAVEASTFTHEGLLFGVLRLPSLAALEGLTVSPYRGLFFASPVLLFALGGIAFMWKSRRAEAAGVSVIAAAYIAAIASFNHWHGGWAFGPRYLLPIVPLLGVAMLHLPWSRSRPLRWLWIATACVSIAVNFIATATDAMPAESLRDPVRSYLVPAFMSGRIPEETRLAFPWYGSTKIDKVALPRDARNLGEPVFGEGTRSSAMPMLLWIIGGTVLLAGWGRRSGSEPSTREAEPPGSLAGPPRAG